VHAWPATVETTRERLVLSAALALTFACQLDKLIDTPGPPGLGVAPARVAESALEGSADARPVALVVSSARPAAPPWTAHREMGRAWLVLTDSTSPGAAADTLKFTLHPDTLAPGIYRDAIVVVPNDPSVGRVRVPVELRIDPAPVGTVTVTARTTGGGTPDPNGYTVTVNGGLPRTIGNNGSTTYTLAAESYSVALGDVATTCTVTNGASRPVTVIAGQPTTVTFDVDCPTTPPPTGTLTVSASTTPGGTPDTNGYTVTVDGSQLRTIGINGSTMYTLAAANYTVALGDIATTCTVNGGPSRTVTVTGGQPTLVSFSVDCPTPPPGTLTVSASTTPGGTPDPDGYTVTVDGAQLRTIGINGSTPYTLAAGTYTVALGDVAPNCTVTNGAYRPGVTMTAGQARTVTFEVDCPTTPPPTGTLTVSASTASGGTPDPNGYTVTVDGGQLRNIGINGSTTYTLAVGPYTVDLGDIATNCTVSGGTSRTVTVTAGQPTPVPFTVDCPTPPPPTGTLTVSASTASGGTPDPNGYSVTVDGGQLRTIGINGSTTYTLAVGPYTVDLGDIATNCTVSGGTSRTVTVTAGQPTPAPFTVDCPTPPPPTGTLIVSASTTPGGTPDPNGYTVTVNGGQLRTIGINGSTPPYTLAVGSYTVALGDIAPNCSVTNGSTSRTVSVTAGQTTTETFTVDCPTPPPPTGTLTVSASTTPGGTPDPNGYTVTVNGGQLRNIGINGSTTYTLAAGPYTVDLGDIATNCTVSGGTSRPVTVTAGQPTSVPFTVDCPTPPPPTGTLTVSASTTPGGTPDPNGYSVTVNGGQLRNIGINGSTTYTLAAGPYTVDLGDIATNCTVSGGTSRTVTVTAGQPTPVPFTVDCPTPPPPTGTLTVSASTTAGGTPDPNGYTVTVNGGQLRNIGINGSTTYTLAPANYTVDLGDIATNCTVSGGTSRTVTVTAGQPTPVSFTVDCPAPPPPPATHVEFTLQPPSPLIILQTPFSVTVTALNAQGGVATGFTGLVRLDLQGPVLLGGLTGVVEVPAVGGVARFTNLRVTGLCTSCSLVASASGLTGATSVSFAVVAGQ